MGEEVEAQQASERQLHGGKSRRQLMVMVQKEAEEF